MRAKKLASLLLTLIMLFCAVVPALADGETGATYQLGDKMEDFTVTLSDGTEVSLYGLLETKKAVLINLWATWCGPCRNEFPYMQKAYNDMSDDIGVIALSVEQTDTDEGILAFKEELGLDTLPMGRDTVGLDSMFDHEGIPVSIMVDRNGIVCYVEVGALFTVSQFKSLFTTFTGDDYSDPVLLTEIPAKEVTVAPDSDKLSAAVNAEGSEVEFVCGVDEEKTIWPFVPSEDGTYVSAANLDAENTNANMSAQVDVEAGDVLTYEYRVVGTESSDRLTVYVNDEGEKLHSGNFAEWTQDGIKFNEAGSYVVSFIYTRGADVNDETVCDVRNVKLITGDEAAAFVNPDDALPKSLEGDAITIELLDEGEPLHELLATTDVSSNAGIYMLPQEYANIKIRVGKEIKANMISINVVHDMMYAQGHLLSNMDHDDDGYFYTVDLSQSSTGIMITCSDATLSDGNIFLFGSKEQAQEFTDFTVDLMSSFAPDNKYDMSIVDKDGNVIAHSASSNAQAADDTTAEDGPIQYKVKYTDESGAPVQGVMTQFCDDSTCSVALSGEDGVATYESENAYAYDVHVLKVPEGYESVGETFKIDENGGEIEIVLKKA